MTMTDPIADMLTRLRNASAAKHETVDMPYSKFKANIAEILKREGYIKDLTAKEAKVGQTLEVTLKYGPNGERSIQGIKRISKPGLRRYAKSDALPMPLGGLGIAIISTSSGLLTQNCRRQAFRGRFTVSRFTVGCVTDFSAIVRPTIIAPEGE